MEFYALMVFYCNIAPDKRYLYFSKLHENMGCGYSLEVPRLGAALLMGTHNIWYRGIVRKLLYGYPVLFGVIYKTAKHISYSVRKCDFGQVRPAKT